MEVVEMDGGLFAICPKDTEIAQISLAKNDVSKYGFSIDKLIKEIRKANTFTGDSYTITSRLYFIGERVVRDLNTAFILVLFHSIQSAEPHLLSLSTTVPANYQQKVVVTPSLSLSQQPIYSKLRAASVFPVTLPPSFGKQDFKISYLTALNKRMPVCISPEPPTLTERQLADYEIYGYLCQDHLHIPGTFPRERSNDIFLNGHKLCLGDSLFVLLLRFVVELKKGKGGWVNIYTLETEKIITDVLKYQIYSNLRTALEGSLREKDGKKFIESSGSKKYRISTHPDFVTYDRKKLINHPDPDIVKLAKQLP
jgi:hypothetical protein